MPGARQQPPSVAFGRFQPLSAEQKRREGRDGKVGQAEKQGVIERVLPLFLPVFLKFREGFGLPLARSAAENVYLLIPSA